MKIHVYSAALCMCLAFAAFCTAADVISTPVDCKALQTSVAKLEQPIEIHGISLQVDAGVGIAVSPQHGDDAATLLQRADIAIRRNRTKDTRGFV